jgi:DNA-binding transcriptional ArsR family regulator
LVRDNLPFVVTNAADLLTALGDPTRQAIVDRLADGPMAVGELTATLDITRPAVSQHLKVLKDLGLVTDTKQGTRRLYRVDPDALAAVRAHLDGFWSRALAAFADPPPNRSEQEQ